MVQLIARLSKRLTNTHSYCNRSESWYYQVPTLRNDRRLQLMKHGPNRWIISGYVADDDSTASPVDRGLINFYWLRLLMECCDDDVPPMVVTGTNCQRWRSGWLGSCNSVDCRFSSRPGRYYVQQFTQTGHLRSTNTFCSNGTGHSKSTEIDGII